ncbi:hypothetical protein FIM06_3687 [Bacillus velezensis]|nr:hypothetical protein FIM06_3687 [Bacillus velezensis]QDF54367.1 hypothetical protein D069_3686 [Bacillus velezensis]
MCRSIPPLNRLNIHYFKINRTGNAKKFCAWLKFARKLPENFAGKERMLAKHPVFSDWHGTCFIKRESKI